jgi:HEAT repeat protein
MAENLDILLEKLSDETRPVRSLDLAELSDLSRAAVGQVRLMWAMLGEERRVELISAMVEQAETNIHLNFHALLRIFLDDPDSRVRRAAIEGLWEDEKTNLIAPLAAILQADPAADVRAAAATSLGRYILLGVLGEIAEHHAQQVETELTDAWFRSGELVEVRRRALEGLAYLNTPAINESIQNAYFDENELMRQSALFAMGRSADRRWARVVLDELSSQEPPMRFEAAVAAGEMGLREAVQPLSRRLNDADSTVREAATSSLGKIGGPAAKRALENLLGGSDEALAQAAEDALDELSFNADHLDSTMLEVKAQDGRAPASARAASSDAEDAEEDASEDEDDASDDASEDEDGIDLWDDDASDDDESFDDYDDESSDDEDLWDDASDDADDDASDDEDRW